jgi:hypothetical protein
MSYWSQKYMNYIASDRKSIPNAYVFAACWQQAAVYSVELELYCGCVSDNIGLTLELVLILA